MPLQPTYPGVYIEEIPSGVRTITGVATAITAFIGLAIRGPLDIPVTINSFGDYERRFGGLWSESMMSYAVRDFYLNGGGRTVIVRVANGARFTTITLPAKTGPSLVLISVSPGAWGNQLSASVDYPKDPSDLFNLTVKEAGGATETFLNVSINPANVRFLPRVLEQTSALVRVSGDIPTERPSETFVVNLPTAAGKLPLSLLSIGDGPQLTAEITYPNPDNGKLFNITIKNGTATPETYDMVGTDALEADYFPEKIKNSNLVRLNGKMTDTRPALTALPVTSKPTNIPATPPQDIEIQDGDGNTVLILRPIGEKSGDGIKATVAAPTTAGPGLFDLQIDSSDGAPEDFKDVTLDDADDKYVAKKLTTSKLVKVGSVVKAQPVEAVYEAKASGAPNGYPLLPDQYIGYQPAKTGFHALENAEFNLLCIPPHLRDDDTAATIYQQGLDLCVRKRAMLIVDPPANWGTSADNAIATAETVLSDMGLLGSSAKNAALYFPRIRQADPQRQGQISTFVPCGVIAGVMARTDSTRGVWKSPAGLDASLIGVQALQVNLTDEENGILNPRGINCLRQFPVSGRVVWGARTLRGADQIADTDNKYVAVRRTSLFLEESLYRATQWVVFEPNDEPLWSQIRLNVGAFMHDLFLQGAFQGKTPREAYLVKCDSETTIQTDINQGVVNVLVGFAPLKPAEFVFIKIQQLSGQIDI